MKKTAAFSDMETKKAGPATRAAQKNFQELEKKVDFGYTHRDFLQVLRRLENSHPSSRPSILHRLYSMFETCKIAYSPDASPDDYRMLIASAALPDEQCMEAHLTRSILDVIEGYQSSSAQMLDLVNHLEDPADGWKDDSLRLRILKQLIVYGDFLSASGFASRKTITQMIEKKIGRFPSMQEIIDHLEDHDFDVLRTSSRAERKRNGRYGLLKAADDLSKGVFHSQNGSVQVLYLFGICYGMKCFEGRAFDEDYYRDFEQRIFRDFYTNNLMKFFMSEDRKEDPVDPSGRGINWKNPYELIYLYWMNRPEPPAFRLRQAEKMIRTLKNRKTADEQTDLRGSSFSTGCAIDVSHTLLFGAMDEKTFLDYLSNSYARKPDGSKNTISVMSVHAAQNSAWKVYQSLRFAFFRQLVENGESILDHRYGLYFLDSSSIPGLLRHSEECGLPCGAEKIEAFERLLRKTNALIGHPAAGGYIESYEEAFDDRPPLEAYFRGELQKSAAKDVYEIFDDLSPESLEDPDFSLLEHLDALAFFVERDGKLPWIWKACDAFSVTRLRLMGVLYYAYNSAFEMEGGAGWKPLREVFLDFKAFCDPYLEAAYYLPVSYKCLYDVLLAYSCFSRMNF